MSQYDYATKAMTLYKRRLENGQDAEEAMVDLICSLSEFRDTDAVIDCLTRAAKNLRGRKQPS